MVISKFDIVPLQLKSLNGGHIFLNLFNSIDLQKLQQYFYVYIFDIPYVLVSTWDVHIFSSMIREKNV